jgi:hypothetical protein
MPFSSNPPPPETKTNQKKKKNPQKQSKTKNHHFLMILDYKQFSAPQGSSVPSQILSFLQKEI